VDIRIDTKVSTDHTSLLYRLSHAFNSSLNLEEVLNNVIDQIIRATRAESGFLALRQQDGKLEFPVARGIDRITIEDPLLQITPGVIQKVIEEGESILVSGSSESFYSNDLKNIGGLGTVSIMCVPLVVRDNVIGAVYLENCIDAGAFTEEDMELLNTISVSAAIAIDNARLFREAVEKSRMERELQVAREIQRDFIPRVICQPLNWEISAYLEAAREVGGDFYDVISLDEDRLVGLVIGDVCNKGLGSALFMALFRSLIRAFAEQHVCSDGRSLTILTEKARALIPGESNTNQSAIDVNTLVNTVYLTNQYINNHHHISNMFTTLFFGVIDPLTGTMEYVNCGHEPPIVINPKGIKARLNPTGPVLGIFPDMRFDVNRIKLAPGDTLLAYTDGVIYALNSKGEPFSEERLISLVQSQAESVDVLLDKIALELHTHVSSQEQFDDMALLAVKWIADGKISSK
jgi:serine phosphatase RsbU (regulator of sigma subunit)